MRKKNNQYIQFWEGKKEITAKNSVKIEQNAPLTSFAGRTLAVVGAQTVVASRSVVARLRLTVIYVDGTVVSGVAVLTKARVTAADCRKKKKIED